MQKEIIAHARGRSGAGDRGDAGARVDARSSRGRPGPKSATPPTPWTRAPTPSCWRARRRPASSRSRGADARRHHPRRRTDAAAFPHVLPAIDPTVSLHGRALCEAAVTLATTARAAAIVAVTHEGRRRGCCRRCGRRAPILAATPNLELAASLTLWWGVEPFVSVETNLDRLEAADARPRPPRARLGRRVHQREPDAPPHGCELPPRA